jgi:hypothetical protein
VKVDINKVLNDIENDADLDPEIAKKKVFYMFNNVNFGFVARISFAANKYKGCCGNKAYEVAALQKIMCDKVRDSFDLYFDGELYS